MSAGSLLLAPPSVRCCTGSSSDVVDVTSSSSSSSTSHQQSRDHLIVKVSLQTDDDTLHRAVMYKSILVSTHFILLLPRCAYSR